MLAAIDHYCLEGVCLLLQLVLRKRLQFLPPVFPSQNSWDWGYRGPLRIWKCFAGILQVCSLWYENGVAGSVKMQHNISNSTQNCLVFFLLTGICHYLKFLLSGLNFHTLPHPKCLSLSFIIPYSPHICSTGSLLWTNRKLHFMHFRLNREQPL